MLCLMPTSAIQAQVGDYRNDLSIGVNGGWALSNVGFVPRVDQGFHQGITGGMTLRYVCEKYFKSICSVYAEVNYASVGWKQNIVDIDENPVINTVTGVAETYQRTINYIQIPIMANLAWGRERNGFLFFVQAGPQMGIFLNEKTESNYALETRNKNDRANPVVAQENMPVENKFDYGIAGGLGMGLGMGKAGHLMLEARYYFALGNIYGSSKRDYFGKSNLNNISLKISYLIPLTRTK